MAYNRYVNQDGRRRRLVVQEDEAPLRRPQHGHSPGGTHRPGPGPGLNLMGLGSTLKNLLPQDLDTGDLLLFAVLLLLYTESGDTEALILLGVLLFMK